MLILKFFFLPLTIFLPAFFSASETAFTSLSSRNLLQLKGRYPFLKPLFEFWENYPDKVLASIVLGNTFGTVLCGILAVSIGKDFTEFFGFKGEWFILLSSLVVTLLVLLFGEVLPKILGRLHSETVARLAVIPLITFTKSIHPLIRILVNFSGFFTRLLGATLEKEVPVLSVEELKGMLEAESVGDLKPPTHRILKNIVEFGQLKAEDIQQPIENIVAAEIHENPLALIAIVIRSPYSRILVYKGSISTIVGTVYIKDLLASWRTNGLILLSDLLRPTYFVSCGVRLSELLREFKKGHYHLAVVQDKSGRATGIITMEDILEEIVGEVYDESDY